MQTFGDFGLRMGCQVFGGLVSNSEGENRRLRRLAEHVLKGTRHVIWLQIHISDSTQNVRLRNTEKSSQPNFSVFVCVSLSLCISFICRLRSLSEGQWNMQENKAEVRPHSIDLFCLKMPGKII